ncbi:dephospho-CoA kinase [Paenibacillus sp. N1-5-1-14]|uniref:dephospho-CoA kinase n=1 Tax=Paenibacillus radicibacter TaxID=2972488 RepID=UPI0021599DA3|nr:dephospho-CoA kinase [Paenibacillus radicibacter]MCR8643744.1 dephospho-CoA kinase [Paenibacillus radicibacter]
MNIGLTGGIACGKSTVAAKLVQLGAILIDADVIAREVVMPGTPGLQQITAHFGPEVLQEDYTLNRKALGSLIFGDEEQRFALNAILHPLIRARIKSRLAEEQLANPDKLVVVDIPLLYESQYEVIVDQVMVVYIPRELQVERLMARDGYSLEEAESRLQSQMSIEEKRQRADIVIDNRGTIAATEEQIETFWKGIEGG